MRKRFYAVYLMIFVLFFSCAKDQKVATVGSYSIDLQEFKMELQKDRYAPKPLTDEYAFIKLNRMIDDKVVLTHAERENYDELPSVIDRAKTTMDNEVYMATVERYVFDKVIPESILREMYDKNGKQWVMSHIMLKKGSDDENAAAIKKLQDIRAEIGKSYSFAEAATKFSQDSLTAAKGGDLGGVKWGAKNFGDAFYTGLSKVKAGELSPVLESAVGYHLVEVKEIRDLNTFPFETQKTSLRRSLFPQYTTQLDSVFYTIIDVLNETYKTETNQENISTLSEIVKTAGSEGPSNPNVDLKAFIAGLDPDQKKLPLATFKNESISIEDLLNIYTRISPRRRPPIITPEQIEQLLKNNVARRLMVLKGYDDHLDKKQSVQDAVNAEKATMMIQMYKRDKFVHPVVTPEEISAYYEEHKDEFQVDVRMNVQEIYTLTEEEAKDVKAKLNAGGDFDLLAERFNVREKTKDNKGMLGWINPKQYSLIGRTAEKMQVGEISDPIRIGGHFSVIRVLDRTFDHYKTLDEVKSQIQRDIYMPKDAAANEAWLKELAKDVKVKINKPLLKKEFGFEN